MAAASEDMVHYSDYIYPAFLNPPFPAIQSIITSIFQIFGQSDLTLHYQRRWLSWLIFSVSQTLSHTHRRKSQSKYPETLL